MRYFHIDYKVRTDWFAPILQRFKNAGTAPRSDWPSEYAYGVATKFEIVGSLRASLNSAIAELDQDLTQKQKIVDKCTAERGRVARAYPLSPELAFKIVAALECFVTEALATWDIALAFAVKLCRRTSKHRLDRKAIENKLKANGVNLSWLDMREKLRNFHLHEGSIWIAAQVTSEKPRRYELVVLRRNTLDLSDRGDWIAWSELEGLYHGLNGGLAGLRAWLLQQPVS